ncbi:MAG: hypothetical protein L0H78_20335 [Humibacillus sp.]|nr:hypothetical protein [Humibacillus sp.]
MSDGTQDSSYAERLQKQGVWWKQILPFQLDLLTSYLPYLRPGGSVFVVCPQEVGYRSDPTHVSFTTDADISRICRAVGSTPVKADGFPFPRPVGKLFLYNEFCVPATKAA